MKAMLPGLLLLLAAVAASADEPARGFAARVGAKLATLDATVAPAEQKEPLRRMVAEDAARRLRAASAASTAGWKEVKSRADWEAFARPKLAALRESLGRYPSPAGPPAVRVTATRPGDGFIIDNLLFESRPGLWVTANLYRPAAEGTKRPAMLIVHAHHTPKEHGELQDMGMTWARAGGLVLVMDQLGHGERRQHPFVDASSYPKPFRVSRQDYAFRYDSGIQLHLAGDSLAGWMVHDLRRGVDLLLARPDVDPQRVILLGSVAGGGDPAAVAAALDDRIAAAVPFNFGGPQPETRYPLANDAEASFHYAGGGSWESTRNLTRSAADGFLPWVIVAGTAPRRLVYAHEFSWDRARDPVWKRLETIWGLYGVPDRLAFTHGRGTLQGQPPEASHCTHIGPLHRVLIHEAFRRWFDLDVTPAQEYSRRLPAADLRCLTPEAARELKPKRLTDLLGPLADARADEARARRAARPADKRLAALRADWTRILGRVEPGQVEAKRLARDTVDGLDVERYLLTTEPGVTVPVLLLTVSGLRDSSHFPVVVAVSQQGKAALLKERSSEIAALLMSGTAVCLPDVRGTGETALGASRARQSTATGVSSSLLMLGDPMLAGQVRDLRGVLAWLRTRPDLDGAHPSLWGDSLARVNPPDVNCTVPRDDDSALPASPEPLGGLLALLGALYEDGVRSVHVHGGLSSFRSALERHLVVLPHDAVVPGVLTIGDLDDVAAALAPRPLRLTGLVNGGNQRLSAAEARAAYSRTTTAYRTSSAAKVLVMEENPTTVKP